MSAHSDDPAQPAPADDMLILFPREARPTAAAIMEVASDAPWLDHVGPELDDTDGGAIALQRAGLGFDLTGLAPGLPLPVPHPLSALELPSDFAPARIAAASLRLGPHIEAGRGNLAILREWFALAAALGEALGAAGIVWTPAGLALGPAMLARNLQAWAARGELPVTLLASFHPTLDGAVQSRGLAFFIGQEFRIEPQLVRGAGQVDALARLLFRHLVYAGPQSETGQLSTPDGHPLRIEAAAAGHAIRVWPG
jgi:hypothetical protein|tara:strand:- start:4688 stop:5449 length:762 start_codon:yes stop_codon:yes gene_type:complete